MQADAAESQNINTLLTAQTETGTVTYYESHTAEIIFSASEGGFVTSGDSVLQGASDTGSTNVTSASTSDSSSVITERYEDSLTGTSAGARAVAKTGFRFVWWIDADTGDVLSTSAYFVPERPESGWPAAWHIMAVFRQNVIHVVLDPNGGSAGGGGGSSGSLTLVAGDDGSYQLPINGTEIEYTKLGSAFSGWNTVADPNGAGASRSYFIADGQAIDDNIIDWFERLGIVGMDWTTQDVPTLTLYAQWLKGQVSISYKSAEGGTVVASQPVESKSDTFAIETIDSNTGLHANNPNAVGPQGARAISNARYHFDGWDIKGSPVALSDEERASATLSSGIVTRASYYADATGLPYEYHGVSFTAQFAPNSYVIVYGPNGGSGDLSTTVTYGSNATLASAGLTRSGYKLSGWNVSAAGTGTSYALGSSISSSDIDALISSGRLKDADGSTVTLYAQWVEDSSATNDPTPTPVTPDTPTPTPNTDNDGGTSGGNGGSANTGGTNTEDKSQDAKNATPTTTPASGTAARTSDTTSSPDTYIPSRPSAYAPSSSASAGSDRTTTSTTTSITPTTSENNAPVTPTGALAATGRVLAELPPVGIPANGSAANGQGVGATDGQSFSENSFQAIFGEMSASEAVEATGTAVATVTAVGAIAGLVGLGASVAGASAAGAAAIGTAATIGLSSAADMAADLAAESSASATSGGFWPFGAGRRKKEDDDEEAGA